MTDTEHDIHKIAERVDSYDSRLRLITWAIGMMLMILVAGIPWAYSMNERLARLEENTNREWLIEDVKDNSKAIRDHEARITRLEERLNRAP